MGVVRSLAYRALDPALRATAKRRRRGVRRFGVVRGASSLLDLEERVDVPVREEPVVGYAAAVEVVRVPEDGDAGDVAVDLPEQRMRQRPLPQLGAVEVAGL